MVTITMKVIRTYSRNENEKEIELSSYKNLTLAIDGSTDCTGIAIITDTRKIFDLVKCKREKTKESAVRYKLELKKYLASIILNTKKISRIVYEEPCMDNRTAIKNLYMLFSTVKEILIENEDILQERKIEYIEISNMKWKKLLLAPSKVPNKTEKAKEAVTQKIYFRYPELIDLQLSQDEVDALGIGYATLDEIKENLINKPVARKFAYNIEFIGTQEPVLDINTLLQQQQRLNSKIPKSVINNGIKEIKLERKKNFEETIRKDMSNDDILLVYSFQSGKQGSIILHYKLSDLAKESNYIYIIVWRKRRTQSLSNII